MRQLVGNYKMLKCSRRDATRWLAAKGHIVPDNYGAQLGFKKERRNVRVGEKQRS